jgi:uncharacterized membrane protein YsdA (DUF1294 family)
MLYFILYTILINIISYFIMKLDKYYARENKRRISEKTLFTLALFLGAIGIYLGMYKFRHKTKHIKFTFLIPILIIINIISAYYIYNYILIYIK